MQPGGLPHHGLMSCSSFGACFDIGSLVIASDKGANVLDFPCGSPFGQLHRLRLLSRLNTSPESTARNREDRQDDGEPDKAGFGKCAVKTHDVLRDFVGLRRQSYLRERTLTVNVLELILLFGAELSW